MHIYFKLTLARRRKTEQLQRLTQPSCSCSCGIQQSAEVLSRETLQQVLLWAKFRSGLFPVHLVNVFGKFSCCVQMAQSWQCANSLHRSTTWNSCDFYVLIFIYACSRKEICITYSEITHRQTHIISDLAGFLATGVQNATYSKYLRDFFKKIMLPTERLIVSLISPRLVCPFWVLQPSGHYKYRQWSLYFVYHRFNIKQFHLLPHTAVFMCFVWIWEQTAVISLNCESVTLSVSSRK